MTLHMNDVSWRELIIECLEKTRDKFEHLQFVIDEGELDRKFDNGFGGEEGAPFTAWSKDFVYFPICYDGSEWVGYAPRNPCDVKMAHQGGG